jgi:hypothetical protein
VGSITKNPNYITLITRGDGQQIQANASSKLGIRIDNRWVNIMEALGFSGDGGTELGRMAAAAFNSFQIFTGNNFLPEIATSHVWRGSNGIELQLNLRFDAWDDASKDVMLPVQRLISWFMPTRSGIGGALGNTIVNGINSGIRQLGGQNAPQMSGQFFLNPPGPTPYDYITGNTSKLFMVTLGNVMIIDDLIPTTLEWEFEERFTKEGMPVAANVTAGFMSYTVPTADKVLGWFNTQLVTISPNATTSLAQALESAATGLANSLGAAGSGLNTGGGGN